MIQKKIKCPDTLWLIKTILDHTPPQETVYDYFDGDDLFSPYEREKGLPIGNLTSQFFANVYLNGFDHYVKEVLGCRAYVRYVDDFAVCADDKAFLWDVKEKMVEYLGQHLRLRLHPVKTRVYQTREGVEFLGFRIFLDRVRLRKENVRRFMARLKRMRTDFQSGTLGKEKIIQRITSWIAHARWADSARLRRVCLKAYLGVNLRNASRLIL